MHQQLNKTKRLPMDIYPDAPCSVNPCEFAGKKYKVVSHYVGKKNINKVIHDLAMKQAYADTIITA